MRQTGPYGPAIPPLWGRFYTWAVDNNVPLTARYGIPMDDPSITTPELCRYNAACEVDAHFIAQGEIALRILDGGLYAKLDFIGTPTECGVAW